MDGKDEIARYAKLSILTLDQSTPPSNINGAEWVSSVLAVYAETGFEHFTLSAFCREFTGVDKSSVMHQYVAMLREEAGASDGAVKEEGSVRWAHQAGTSNGRRSRMIYYRKSSSEWKMRSFRTVTWN